MNLVLAPIERQGLRRTMVLLALLGAVGLFLGYANPLFQLPPLALLFPACLATIARLAPNGKWAFYPAWLSATLANSACLHWLSVAMHDYGQMPWVVTVFPILALGAYLGLYAAAFALGYHLFRRRLPFFAALLLAAPLWASLEIAKGWMFTGFPWVNLSTAFVAWPVWVQAASVIGADGLSGVLALSAVALTEAFPVRVTGGQAPTFPARRKRQCLLLAALCLAVVAGYGKSALSGPEPEGKRIRVGMIQGNIDQNQKWEAGYQIGTLSRYLVLSEWTVNPAMGRVEEPVDLVVWPETAMPFYLESNPQLAGRIANFSKTFSVPVAFGAPGRSRVGSSGYHNRLWLQTPDDGKRQSYDKTHLVPFGEYVPFNLPIPFIEYFMQGLDFRPGQDSGPLVAADLALGGLICYEAIFPRIARRRAAEGANVLVNISNDAWFGNTSAPVQHLHLTAMRAIEQGRYVVRATNTGISAVISSRGIILGQGSLFRAESLVGEATLLTAHTVFYRAAPFILWGCLTITMAAAAVCLLRGRHARPEGLHASSR